MLGTVVGDEVVQGGVKKGIRGRKAAHGLEDADKIPPLKWKQFVQCLDASLQVVSQNHLLDGALTFVASFRLLEIGEEHVLFAAQANALRPKLDGLTSVLRPVDVSPDPWPPPLR